MNAGSRIGHETFQANLSRPPFSGLSESKYRLGTSVSEILFSTMEIAAGRR